ncbi:MAG: hypothetical protein ACNA8H_08645, partial [Anaerolineales bacterium]
MTEKSEISQRKKSVSFRKYRRQSFLKIYLPLVFSILAVVVFIILVGYARPEVISVWSGVSLIFLIVPTLVIGLIVLLILGFGVYGLGRVLSIIHLYFSQLQEAFGKLELQIRKASDGAVKPFIRIRGASAGLRAGMAH